LGLRKGLKSRNTPDFAPFRSVPDLLAKAEMARTEGAVVTV
jgi:hypothetical protein